MVELYAPVRRQFFTALPFLILLVFGSMWLIRIRVYPLVAALDQAHRDMTAMALHDGLTGLPNRILFHDRLTQAMRRTRRSQSLMALMYLDIDHFKQINDSQGHLAGDEVLRNFANILKECVRASDTVARLGGDEFTLLLENISTRRDAERTAESILENVKDTLRSATSAEAGTLSASIGIAYYRGEELAAEQLIHQADTALYQSKQRGRARYHVHEVPG
jgi:diguanylate cyclase (GGDEF)-like protein